MVRLKHRYLVVHILYLSESVANKPAAQSILQFHRPSPANIDIAHLLRIIRASVEYMYGDYGLGLISSSLKINYFSPATSTAIVRVARAHFRILWAALTWMTGLERTPASRKIGDAALEVCVFRVVRVCGTIKKAEEEVICRAKKQIHMATLAANSTSEADFTGLLGNAEEIATGKANTKGKRNRSLEIVIENDDSTEDTGNDEQGIS